MHTYCFLFFVIHCEPCKVKCLYMVHRNSDFFVFFYSYTQKWAVNDNSIFTARAMLCAVYAMALCLSVSVCVCVCLSVCHKSVFY